MDGKKLIRPVMAALFAALVFSGTFFLRAPMPCGFGYLNLGDACLLTAAWIVGGRYGAAAGGIGAALADLALGYTAYVPVTPAIKAMTALTAAAFARMASRRGKAFGRVGLWIGGTAAELLMVGGYYVFEGCLYGFGAAAASVPGNLLQGAAAVVTACSVMTALRATGAVKKLGVFR